MNIEANNDTETAEVFARERAGEFRILGLSRGKTNAAWVFKVSDAPAQPELIPPRMEVKAGAPSLQQTLGGNHENMP